MKYTESVTKPIPFISSLVSVLSSVETGVSLIQVYSVLCLCLFTHHHSRFSFYFILFLCVSLPSLLSDKICHTVPYSLTSLPRSVHLSIDPSHKVVVAFYAVVVTRTSQDLRHFSWYTDRVILSPFAPFPTLILQRPPVEYILKHPVSFLIKWK